MKKNIVLIGMPGVGKSTSGVILAKVMGQKFVDVDLVIQEKEGRLLSTIIKEEGVQGFLDVENKINAGLFVENSVISTGGSVIYGKEAMEHLSKIGIIVYLKLSYQSISRRLRNIKERGVVLKEGQTLRDLYYERAPLYEKYADIIIDEKGMNIEQTVLKIIEEVNKYNKRV
ncbi:MAG: shikimate kinase [Lachnospiraceae bacterium]|nr:shikimate kinase [Lachnospiraceae bacterium]